MADDIAGAYVKISPDLGDFREQLRADLDTALTGEDKTVKVKADTAEADAKMAASGTEADKLNGKTATIKVRVDDGATSRLGKIATAVGALAPLGLEAGAVLGGGAFAALPAILGGGADGAIALTAGLGGVKNALTAFNAANTNTGQSAATAHRQLQVLNADMAQLSPNARAAVDVIAGQLLPAWRQFTQLDQQALFGAALPGLKDIEPIFKAIQPEILSAATGIGRFVSEMAGIASSSTGLREIQTILRSGNGLFADLGTAVESITRGFLNLGSQATPIVSGIGRAVDDVAGAFQRWTSDGGSQKFLSYIEQNGPAVKQFFDQLAQLVSTLAQDWAQLGPFWLSAGTDLLRIADALAKVNPALADAVPEILLLSKGLSAIKALSESNFLANIAGGLGAAGVAGEAEAASSKLGALGTSLSELAGETFVIGVVLQVAETLTGKLPNASTDLPGSGSAALRHIPLIGGIVANSANSIDSGLGADAVERAGAQSPGGNPNASQSGFFSGDSAAQQKISLEYETGKITLAQMQSQLRALANAPKKTTASSPTTGLPSTFDNSVPGSATGSTGPSAAAKALAALQARAQTMLAQLSDENQSASVSSLKTDRNDAHQLAVKNLQTALVKAGQTGLSDQIGAAFAEVGTRLKQQIIAAADLKLQKQGNSTLNTLGGLETSTSVPDLEKSLGVPGSSTAGTLDKQFDKLVSALDNTHKKGLENIATRLTAAHSAALINLNNQLEIQQLTALTTQTNDITSALSSMASIVEQTISDSFSAQTTATTDATQAITDGYAAQAAAIADQSQINIDTMAEAGLSGVALQQQQAKVALDQLKAQWDTTAANDTSDIDSISAAWHQQISAAQANLDSVTASNQNSVNKAQAALDQQQSGTLAYDQAAQALAAAQQTQTAQVSSAQEALATVQGEASAAIAAAQQQLAGDQGLGSVQQASDQAIIDKLTETNNLLSNLGLNGVHIEVNGQSAPQDSAEAIMWELRLAGLAA